MKNNKIFLKWLLKILSTGLFLWLILRSIDLEDILHVMQNVSIQGYIFLFLLFLFKQFLTTWRWHILLGLIGITEPIKALYVSVLYGQTLNQILPSRIGGDSARVAYLFSRHPGKKSTALSATFLDRLLGLFALLILAFVNLPFVGGFNILQKVVGTIILGVLLILVVFAFWGKLDWLFTWLMTLNFIPESIRDQIKKLWKIFIGYRKRGKILFQGLILSLFSQGLMIIGQYFTFRLIGTQISLIKLFLVIPVVTLIVTLPISIGGIGIREVALVNMLAIRNDEVLTFSLIRYSFYILIPIFLFANTLFEYIKQIGTRH